MLFVFLFLSGWKYGKASGKGKIFHGSVESKGWPSPAMEQLINWRLINFWGPEEQSPETQKETGQKQKH